MLDTLRRAFAASSADVVAESRSDARNDLRTDSRHHSHNDSRYGSSDFADSQSPWGTASNDALLGVLDEMDYGVMLMDAGRRILHANQLARREISLRVAVRCEADTLYAALPEQDAELVNSLRAAARGQRSMAEFGAGVQTLTLAFVPQSRLAAPQSRPAFGVLVTFGKRHFGDNLALQCYALARKLTHGEHGVLQALCAGLSAEDIARQNGVYLSTVRSQISSIRAKTGATSMRQLVQRVAALPPMMSALRGTALQ